MPSRSRLLKGFLVCAVASHATAFSAYGATVQIASIKGDNNTVIQTVIEISRGDGDWLARNQSTIENLSQRLGLTDALIIDFLRNVDLSAVPREQWADTLKRHAANFQALKQQASALAATELAGKEMILNASTAAQNAQWSDAESFLSQAEGQMANSKEQVLSNFAELRSLRARVLIGRQAFAEAGEVFLEAAVFAGPIDTSKVSEFETLAGDAFLRAGLERGNSVALERAVFVYRDRLLPKLHKEQDPIQWIRTTEGLGEAFETLGVLTGDEEKLRQSLTLYQEALAANTRTIAPTEWAKIHRLIGNALQAIGSLIDDHAYDTAAIRHYRTALTALDPISDNDDWAAAKNNIGYVLYRQSFYDPDGTILTSALTELNDALARTPKDKMTFGWAITTNNIAAVLSRQGKADEARALYMASLNVCSKDVLPICWARTKFGLANLAFETGEKNKDAMSIQAAIDQFVESLAVFDVKSTPVDWAKATRGLGIAEASIGKMTSNDTLSKQATVTLEHCLAVWSLPRFKMQWIDITRRIADIQFDRGQTLYRPEVLKEAAKGYQEIIDVADRARQPRLWANNQALAGASLALAGFRDPGILNAAVDHLRASLDVYRPDKDIEMWAWLHQQIATALWNKSNVQFDMAALIEARDDYMIAIDFYRENKENRTKAQGQLDQLNIIIAKEMLRWLGK